MVQVSESINISVSKDNFIKVLLDFESYPDFHKNIKNIEVIYNKGNKYRVKNHIKIIQNIKFTLEFELVNSNILKWNLLEGNIMKKNQGYWELTEKNNKQITAKYISEIDLKTPVPNVVLKKIIEKDLPNMLNRFKNQAESLYG